MQALTKECKVAAFANYVAAGVDVAVVNGTAIDTEGFDAISVALKLGAIGAEAGAVLLSCNTLTTVEIS